MAIERLPDHVHERALDMVLEGAFWKDVLNVLGIKSKRAFMLYQSAHPDFARQIEQAQLDSCRYLEEEMLYCADRYNKDSARVKLEALARILKYRDPKRYGDKTQIDMNVSVDITGSLDRAERRVIEAVATNVVQIAGTTKDTP